MSATIARRSLLMSAGTLTVGAGLMAMLPRPASAQQSYYTLSPDWQINWRAHKTTGLATATQIEDGIEVNTPDTAATVDLTTIALWAKRVVNGDFELSFTYKVKDRLDIPGGSFACFYFNTLGQGTGKWIEAVPSWRRVTPSDEVYADHARGLRFSFATHNPNQPDIDHRLRLRWFNKTPTLTLVEPASPAVFPFTDGLAYEMTVRRTGDRLGVSVVPPAASSEEPRSFAWEDGAIGRWSSGHVGFRWRGQDAEITNISLTDLGAPFQARGRGAGLPRSSVVSAAPLVHSRRS